MLLEAGVEPATLRVEPTQTAPDTPAPPVTISEPVVVEVLAAPVEMVTAPTSVDVSECVTAPVSVLAPGNG